jgi:hypothetical protein
MREGWLEEAVRLSKLSAGERFPRQLEEEVECFLPVFLVKLPALTTHQVRDWLGGWNIAVEVPEKNRSIHGCMVAARKRGFIFWDSEDDGPVQRFTLAHEVAHFVLDFLQPRKRALEALGPRMDEVFDGKREPNPVEGLSAMLKRIPLAQLRLLDRGPAGIICTGQVDASERRADRLAFELLAPARLALPMLRSMPRKEGVAALASRFGLRPKEARSYARILLGPEHRPFSIQKYLDEEE